MIHSASVYLVVAPVVLNSLKTAATQLSRLRPPCAARICETGKPHFAGPPPPPELRSAGSFWPAFRHLSPLEKMGLCWNCLSSALDLTECVQGCREMSEVGRGEREKGREEEREGESPTGRQGLASKCKSNPKSISFIDCLQMQC